MYRKHLISQLNKGNIYLKNNWSMEISGLVRVPFFDSNDDVHGYAVYYSEVKQTYDLIKYLLLTGEIIWCAEVVNGGYGTPLIWKDLALVHEGFTGITAYNKYTGEKVWNYSTESRVRSSFNIIDESLYFSSGGTIFQIDYEGKLLNKINLENTFLFGTISKQQNHLITLGTKYNIETNSSNLYLFGIILSSSLVFEVNIGKGHIISSDTSGFFLSEGRILVNCDNYVKCLDANTGMTIWTTKISGNGGRHIPVCDLEFVFYTTINGYYGCINIRNGQLLWERESTEGCIVTPPSILGDSLLILADSYLFVLDKRKGYVYQAVPIGHSPYSACAIFNNHLLVGGGEPPLHGLLRAFNIVENSPECFVFGKIEIGEFIENKQMELILYCSSMITSIEINTNVISKNKNIQGTKISGGFHFDIELKPNNLSGYYCLPIRYFIGENEYIEGISVFLRQKNPLPTKHIINTFNKDVLQTNALNSGAAIIQMIMKNYGKELKQDEVRKIVNYVKDKSEWVDADFQTWRLILNRVLSSPAKTLNEFIELEKA